MKKTNNQRLNPKLLIPKKKEVTIKPRLYTQKKKQNFINQVEIESESKPNKKGNIQFAICILMSLNSSRVMPLSLSC